MNPEIAFLLGIVVSYAFGYWGGFRRGREVGYLKAQNDFIEKLRK